MKKIRFALAILCFPLSLLAQSAPDPIAPLPSVNQVNWQKMETYAFIHFGPNTFTDKEWGYGDAPLSCFNPTKLDCEQWARTLKDAGMKGIILTAKHHDGFCLWPTKYTDYSIRNTPYKQGKGDIVGELAAACKKYGLKLGLYLSPWDRHQAFYGTPLYVEYFYAQLEELLTKYGEIFEVWFDGANGGDGYYGGAREERKIDRRTYYNFPRAFEMVSRLQPKAVIFSDGGPGCRWVGNESGYAFATNWSFLRSKDVYPGYAQYWELQSGHTDGDAWVAAECNFSIRPGWFYHESQDNQVKSVEQLTDLYYRSVGHNGTMLVNFPVDKDGLIHPIDSARIQAFYQQIKNELKTDLLAKSKVVASTSRGKSYSAKAVIDGNDETYWATPDGVLQGTLTFTLPKKQQINRMKLQEYIPLGQRVKSFVVEYLSGKEWLPLKVKEETTTIGYCRLLRFPTITTRQLRVRFLDARGPLCIHTIAAYFAPNALESFDVQPKEIKSLPFTATQQDDGFLIDLGENREVKAFYYLPNQGDNRKGLISSYTLYAGENPDEMGEISHGEFSNIRNNPVLQEIYFTPIRARYLKLKANRMVVSGETPAYQQLFVQ